MLLQRLRLFCGVHVCMSVYVDVRVNVHIET